MTSMLDQTLSALREKKEGALMPFLVIGDPDLRISHELALALARGGADLLEFGLAFSDPPADGPVIQAGGKRALQRGVTTDLAFAFLEKTKRATNLPIALLLYYNLVLQQGVSTFYKKARAAGVDAILVADAPIEESGEIIAAAEAHRIAPIFIVSELTTEARLKAIAKHARGYLYLVARVGVTGERRDVDQKLAEVIARVKKFSTLPILAGFGLSKPEHVADVVRAGADGAIVGSALVQRIEQNLGDEARTIAEVEAFVRAMKGATRHEGA